MRLERGQRAQAIIGYLTGRMSASHRDVVEAMAVLYGLTLSTGSVSAIQRQVSHALRAQVESPPDFHLDTVICFIDERLQ